MILIQNMLCFGCRDNDFLSSVVYFAFSCIVGHNIGILKSLKQSPESAIGVIDLISPSNCISSVTE